MKTLLAFMVKRNACGRDKRFTITGIQVMEFLIYGMYDIIFFFVMLPLRLAYFFAMKIAMPCLFALANSIYENGKNITIIKMGRARLYSI